MNYVWGCNSLLFDRYKHFYFFFLILYLNFNHHLPKVTPTLKELEGLFRLHKGKHPIHHGPNLMLLIEADHLLKPILRSINNALQSHRPPQSQEVHIQPVIPGIYLAGDVTDAVDETTKCDAIKALSQRLGTTGLEDDIRAVVLSPIHDLFFPVGRGAVVDGIVGAELFGLFQLCIRGRSNNRWKS